MPDDGPISVPEYFGSATLTSVAHPDCQEVVGGEDVTIDAAGYLPEVEVIVSMQLVDAEATVVARVTSSVDGTVAVPVAMPDAPPGTIGGFEVIGDGARRPPPQRSVVRPR
ncbi:MAG: hypothetical protein H0W25_19395 [Acidimicrobiia bacterium]|nr:hypothetical protein [Acidimicrobiia bacterium]